MHRYQSSSLMTELCSGSWPEQTLTSRKKNVSPKQVGTRALSSFHQRLPQAESVKGSQWWCKPSLRLGRLAHTGAFSISGYRITCQHSLAMPCGFLKPCSWKDSWWSRNLIPSTAGSPFNQPARFFQPLPTPSKLLGAPSFWNNSFRCTTTPLIWKFLFISSYICLLHLFLKWSKSVL